MNLQFKNPDGALSATLQERIERKLAKYARFVDTPEGSANTYFEIGRSVGSHQQGAIWEARITIDAKGNRYYASELADTPEKAALGVLKEIRGELRKAHDRGVTRTKKLGAFLKSFGRRSVERP